MTAAIHRWTAWLRTPAGVLLLGLFILFLNGCLTAAFALCPLHQEPHDAMPIHLPKPDRYSVANASAMI
jgi:hypothetical protein